MKYGQGGKIKINYLILVLLKSSLSKRHVLKGILRNFLNNLNDGQLYKNYLFLYL